MIVLLGCSINLSAKSEDNSNNLSTGGVVIQTDSVLIAYDDLRIVNSKLIELKYEKEINTKLYDIISNDSIIISNYKLIHEKLNEDCRKTIKQRNIAIGGAIGFFIISLLSIIK